MPFYAFRLNSINVQNQRGKIPDDDVVTFQVVVNNVLRGQGTIILTDVVSGAFLPLVPPPSSTFTFTPLAPNPSSAQNINNDWIIGPLQIAPTDGVTVLVSGTNISDQYQELSQQDQDTTETQIADAFYGAFFGEIADGPAGAALGSVLSKGSDLLGKIFDALGILKDPVGQLLNVQAQGPCNGVAFASNTQLTGWELAQLTFAPHFDYASLPNALEFPISVHLDDSVNHNTGTCGHVAETDVSFSVLEIPYVPVRDYLNRYYPRLNPENGIRQYAAAGMAIDMRKLLHLTV